MTFVIDRRIINISSPSLVISNRNSNLMTLKLKTICCRILFLIQVPCHVLSSRFALPLTNSSSRAEAELYDDFPPPTIAEEIGLLNYFLCWLQMFSVFGDYPCSPKRKASDGTQWRNSLSSFWALTIAIIYEVRFSSALWLNIPKLGSSYLQ